MLLLLFYQGSYVAFADVPLLNSAGRRKVNRKGPERVENPFAEVIAPLERQVFIAKARELDALAALQRLESKAANTLETLAKATVARHKVAVAKQRAVVAALNTEIETLNAAMAVEEADVVFIFSILSEA